MDGNRSLTQIGSYELPLVRCKLRAWLQLERIRKDILDAVDKRNGSKLVYSIYSYVSTVSSISIPELEQFSWFDIAKIYRSFYNINTPNIDLPFIRPRRKDKIHEEEVGWDYPNREFYLWANVLASSYGWTIDYISELDIDDALALIQEILVDEQLQKEWEWSMSQNAYSYDPSTKRSKFISLKRPEWMTVMQKIRDIPKSKIRIENIPVGIVLRWDDGTPSKPQ